MVDDRTCPAGHFQDGIANQRVGISRALEGHELPEEVRDCEFMPEHMPVVIRREELVSQVVYRNGIKPGQKTADARLVFRYALAEITNPQGQFPANIIIMPAACLRRGRYHAAFMGAWSRPFKERLDPAGVPAVACAILPDNGRA
jgi:hypothetical protein